MMIQVQDDMWEGLLPENVPVEIRGGARFRAMKVHRGAYKNHRLVVNDPSIPASHKDSYDLDYNGLVIVRRLDRAWLINTGGAPDNQVPLKIQFFQNGVGVGVFDKDRKLGYTVGSAPLVAKSLNANALWVVGASDLPDFPIEDMFGETQFNYWDGWIKGTAAFRLFWRITNDLGGAETTTVGVVDSVADANEGGEHRVHLNTALWDWRYNGAGAPTPASSLTRCPLVLAPKNFLQIQNVSAGPASFEWATGTKTR
ncbi:MAG: hypothetical protein ACPG77_02800 [Nannocystaceae bacterium]